jgi:hypothetical protein
MLRIGSINRSSSSSGEKFGKLSGSLEESYRQYRENRENYIRTQ